MERHEGRKKENLVVGSQLELSFGSSYWWRYPKLTRGFSDYTTIMGNSQPAVCRFNLPSLVVLDSLWFTPDPTNNKSKKTQIPFIPWNAAAGWLRFFFNRDSHNGIPTSWSILHRNNPLSDFTQTTRLFFSMLFFSSRQSWKVENWVLKKLAIFHWTMILGERLHCWKLTDGILKIIHFPWNLEEFWCLAVRFRGCMVGYMLGSMTYDFPFLPTTFLRSLTIPSWWSYANVKNGNHVSNVRDKKYHTKLRHHHLENMATLEVDHRTVMLPFI